MHELGHNLGLDHGGDEDVNFKPNYISIMNYAFGATGLLSKNGRQRKVDYSRSELPSLNERSLIESVGISDPAGRLTLWNSRPTIPASLNKCVNNRNNYYKIFLPGPALDWNCDGLKTPGIVQADINGDGTCVTAGPDKVLNASSRGGDDEFRGTGANQVIVSGENRTCESTAVGDDEQSSQPGYVEPDLLDGFDDWPALKFDGGGVLGASVPGSPGPTTTIDREPDLGEIRERTPSELLEENDLAPLDEVTASPEEGPAALTVNFDGSASTAVNGTIVNWSWDFGDDTTGSGAIVSHTYNTPGEYYATLIVTDSNGFQNLVHF
jgi:hypothetical protein